MRVIDSHAHLSFDAFDHDLDSVILRAKKAGVIAIINPTITPKDFQVALKITESHKDYIFPALGLAPQILNKELFQEFLAALRKFEGRYIAIGECGLDYHWVRGERETEYMIKAFEEVLEVVETFKKPLIIHARSAHRKNAYVKIAEMLQTYSIKRAVFHAFFGSRSDIRVILSGDWLISIPTVYVRRRDLWPLITSIPLSRMLVETDSPYLSPRKGVRNEPAYVVEVIKVIADIKNVDYEEVAEITTRNAMDFFDLKIRGMS